MDRVVSLQNAKVVEQPPGPVHRLRSNAAPSSDNVTGAKGGNELPQAPDELLSAERTPPLREAASPMPPCHPPESREPQCLGQVPRRHAPGIVSFPLQCEHGIGPGLDTVIDRPGQVNSEKRQRRIGDGIDQALHEMPAFRQQVVVLTSERNDTDARINAAQARHAIGMQAGTVH